MEHNRSTQHHASAAQRLLATSASWMGARGRHIELTHLEGQRLHAELEKGNTVYWEDWSIWSGHLSCVQPAAMGNPHGQRVIWASAGRVLLHVIGTDVDHAGQMCHQLKLHHAKKQLDAQTAIGGHDEDECDLC